ncbi:lipoyl synthase [bacterium]|nr:lipoyl synthase [bacterium]
MHRRLPVWLKKKIPDMKQVEETRDILKRLNLNTVCENAKCPNIGECFSRHTATFMILGDICTRNCRFCAVKHGIPSSVDINESERLGKAVSELGLKYVVVTSVTRDDLKDYGAGQFVDVINSVRRHNSGTKIEILTPDFKGDEACITQVVQNKPDVFGHNIETVPGLYENVRQEADYGMSLNLLKMIKKVNSKLVTKSGIMVGLGETREEVLGVMDDLRDVGCDLLTIGQYLSPSKNNTPVAEFITPEMFAEYKKLAEDKGFVVASGPFVRSSYKANDLFAVAKQTLGNNLIN